MAVSLQDIKKFFDLLSSDSVLSATKDQLVTNLLNLDQLHFAFGIASLGILKQLHRTANVPNLQSPEHDVEAFLEAITCTLHPDLAKQHRMERSSIYVLIIYIRILYEERWEKHLSQLPDSERLNKSWNDPRWASITDGFDSLLKALFKRGLISLEQYKKMPLRTVKDPDGDVCLVLDRCELYFPGQKKIVKSHFKISQGSHHAKTGLFWLPTEDDVGEDGQILPLRLYTPFEEFLLQDIYGSHLNKYLPYLITSERNELPIMQSTYDTLWDWVEGALLIEYQVTIESNRREVEDLIARQIRSSKLSEYAQQMKVHIEEVNRIITSLPDDDEDEVGTKDWLRKYLRFFNAQTYHYTFEITGPLKQALLVAYAAVHQKEVSVLESELETAVSNKLAHLTPADLYAGERALQDEYLERYTERFMIELGRGENLPAEGTEERERLDNQVLYLRGILIDNSAMTYATFHHLVYLMAPQHRVLSACAHTIWGAFLVLLADYAPHKLHDPRIEMRFSERLPMVRMRSRLKEFCPPTPLMIDRSRLVLDTTDSEDGSVEGTLRDQRSDDRPETGGNAVSHFSEAHLKFFSPSLVIEGHDSDLRNSSISPYTVYMEHVRVDELSKMDSRQKQSLMRRHSSLGSLAQILAEKVSDGGLSTPKKGDLATGDSLESSFEPYFW